jgi:hypothetical protein
VLSTLLWESAPWETLRAWLGGIDVFDLGCGKGHYFREMQRVSGGRIRSYTGADVVAYPQWKDLEADPACRFKRIPSRLSELVLDGDCNFVMSQSSLEHAWQDVGLYRAAEKAWFAGRDRAGIQVHMIPSAACLGLYGLHGYRQYTARTVSRFLDVRPESRAQHALIALGGEACNRVHRKWIGSFPALRSQDTRMSNLALYSSELGQALNADAAGGSSQSATFYAFVTLYRAGIDIQSWPGLSSCE